jgi:UDP-N-acetyl-2-amino-2-deoxyglucuronate dehydrogenase
VIEGDRLALLAMMGREPLGGEVAYAHALQVATGGTCAVTSAAADVLESSDPADSWGEAHRRQFLDFVDAVNNGRTPLVDGFEGRNAVELVQAIYRASTCG